MNKPITFDPGVFAGKKRPRRKVGVAKGVLADYLNKSLKEFPELSDEVWSKCKEFFVESCEYAIEDTMGHTSREWRLSPSGWVCPRAEWFKRMNQVVANNNSVIRKEDQVAAPYSVLRDDSMYARFLAGRVAEAWARVYCWMVGLNVWGFEEEVFVPVPGVANKTVTGHIDLIYTSTKDVSPKLPTGTNVVVDVKSVTGWNYRDILKGIYDDLWNNKGQIGLYDKYIKDKYPKKKFADFSLLLCLNIETWRNFAEIIVPPINDMRRDEWLNFAQAVNGKRKPGRPKWAKLKKLPRAAREEVTDPRCKYCALVLECYGDSFKEQTKGKKNWARKTSKS